MADEITTTGATPTTTVAAEPAPVEAAPEPTPAQTEVDTGAAVDAAIKALKEALVADGMPEGTVHALLHAVMPNEINVVGNLATIQTLGAYMDQGASVTEAIEKATMEPTPPSDEPIIKVKEEE